MSISFAIRCSLFAIRHSFFLFFSNPMQFTHSLFAIRYSLFAIRVLTKKKKKIFNPFFSLSRANRESRIANCELRIANWQIANDKFCLKHKCLFFFLPFAIPFSGEKVYFSLSRSNLNQVFAIR